MLSSFHMSIFNHHNKESFLMSAEDDIRREFNRQSSAEQRAVLSSWESFLAWAGRVIRITLDIIDIIRNVYAILKRRY